MQYFKCQRYWNLHYMSVATNIPRQDRMASYNTLCHVVDLCDEICLIPLILKPGYTGQTWSNHRFCWASDAIDFAEQKGHGLSWITLSITCNISMLRSAKTCKYAFVFLKYIFKSRFNGINIRISINSQCIRQTSHNAQLWLYIRNVHISADASLFNHEHIIMYDTKLSILTLHMKNPKPNTV